MFCHSLFSKQPPLDSKTSTTLKKSSRVNISVTMNGPDAHHEFSWAITYKRGHVYETSQSWNSGKEEGTMEGKLSVCKNPAAFVPSLCIEKDGFEFPMKKINELLEDPAGKANIEIDLQVTKEKNDLFFIKVKLSDLDNPAAKLEFEDALKSYATFITKTFVPLHQEQLAANTPKLRM